MGFGFGFGATMRDLFWGTESAFAKGCQPCVVPYRATVQSSRRRSWRRLKSWHSTGPLPIRYGNEPDGVSSCTNNPWCPTARQRRTSSAIDGRCNGGVAGGPRGTFAWKTNRGGAVRPVCPPLDHALVKAVAGELVVEAKPPLRRQSLADMTGRVRRALGQPISRSTGWRSLEPEASKPWRDKYWIVARDPLLAEKAGPRLDLSAGTWQGTPLGPRDHMRSADEQTSIPARLRCHPRLGPAPARHPRVEFEDERGGVRQYLAAWDVRRGYVMGRCEPPTGIAPFGRLVDQVLGQEPYRSGNRLFWMVDHGSSQRGAAAQTRLQQGDSRLILVQTPVHASWLNQVESYFSIIQRQVLTPNDCADLEAIRLRLAVYEELSNQRPTPFQWTFDRPKLTTLLAKIAACQMA